MFKKVITLLFGTAFMVVLMLAAGGIYLLPENFMGAYTNMYTDVWNAVGGLFSLMPGSRLCGGLCRLSEPNPRCSLVYRLCRIGIYQRDQRLVDRHGCAAYPILHILYQRECRRL